MAKKKAVCKRPIDVLGEDVGKCHKAIDTLVGMHDTLAANIHSLNQRMDTLKDYHRTDKKRIDGLQSRADLVANAVDGIEKRAENRIRHSIQSHKQKYCDHVIEIWVEKDGTVIGGTGSCSKCGKTGKLFGIGRPWKRLYRTFTKS